MNSRTRFFLPFVFSLLAMAVPLAASNGEEPINSAVGWVFRWLNFALVFGGGGYFVVKKAGPYFRRRAERVVAEIAEATRAREEAEKLLQEAEEKLRGQHEEVARLRAVARGESATEAERIRKLAREEAQKIERAAQSEIEAAERAARMELKAIAACLAVERAKGILRKQVTPATEADLFRFFVESLVRSAN